MSISCTCVLCNRHNSNINCENCFICNRSNGQYNQHTLEFDGEVDTHNEYYTPSEFRDYLTCKSTENSNTLSFFHFNSRSLKRNFLNFCECVESLNMHMSIIGVTETWLKEGEEMLISLPNYTFVGNTRQGKRGGGVGIFIHDNIKFKRRTDLDICNEVVESIFIEVFNTLKNYIVGVIYKPPQQTVKSFIDNIQFPLNTISNERKESIIMGDFNVDLMKINTVQYVNDFIDNFTSYSYLPQIFKPTRITTNSATILDNIFYNYSEKVEKSGVILTDVSDHLTPFILINFKGDKPKSEMEYTKREINDENIKTFKLKLNSVDWSILNHIDDVNKKYSTFTDIFSELYDECFPEKVIKKKNVNKKPWLSAEIKNMCKRKYSLFKKYLRNPTGHRRKTYKQFRNKVNIAVRDAKRNYYDIKFKHALNDAKSTWKVINEILNKKKEKLLIDEIEFDGKTVTNKSEISNLFNNFFSTVGKKIHDNVHSSKTRLRNDSFKKYLHCNVADSLFFSPITNSDVLKVVLTLDINKSAGYDGFDTKVVISSIDSIVSPLCNIFNASIEKGIFPSALKIAKVLPIFKNGNKALLNNYRPVSILSIFSKMLEKIIYDKLISFIQKHNILYRRQFGFRKGFSTSHAIIDFVDKLAKAFEDKLIVVGIFLDLSKAFDCIDHSILLDKLHFYGIRGTALKWFQSYLSGRRQYVCIDNFKSDYRNISVGVPQGSNLGPLLFLIYINDLQYVSDVLSVILFADDTSLFLSGKNVVVINQMINTEMEKVQSWFLANKLQINYTKTNYMIFKSRNMNVDGNLVHIRFNDTTIQRVKSTKFLGVIIDESLSWKDHINHISLKISRMIGVLNNLKYILPLKVLVQLYNSMILSHLSYCNIVWGNCASYLLQKLFVLQKRAIRVITKSNYLAHTKELFLKLNILDVYSINNFQISVFMYSFTKELLPEIFKDYFTYNSDVNSYQTRNSHKMYIPFYRYTFSRTVISYIGPVIWNNLPCKFKQSPTLSNFKRKYKYHLLQK